jgi:uncharacterized membrane-anchored protein YitT (DUF2179 family)
MDNSNNFSSSILQSSEASFPTENFVSTNSPSENSSGFFDSIKNINITTWLIIILILAFLGLNIFVYLAKGTQDITNFFAPFVQKIFGITIGTTSQVIDVSAEGAKAVVGGTANLINSGLTAVQNITPNSASSSINSQTVQGTIPHQDVTANNTLNRALNTSKSQQNTNNDYEANEASSSVHSVGKAGWCYIGEDRGFRSCAKVGVDDVCMSGDIFPSHEICVNPSLRV